MADFHPKFESLVALFDTCTEQFAKRPPFGTKQEGHWHWMTYRDFADFTRRLHTALDKLGVKAGDRVAIISNNRPEWAIAAYASYGKGAAFVAMYRNGTKTGSTSSGIATRRSMPVDPRRWPPARSRSRGCS